jgi:hypothetical protein
LMGRACTTPAAAKASDIRHVAHSQNGNGDNSGI